VRRGIVFRFERRRPEFFARRISGVVAPQWSGASRPLQGRLLAQGGRPPASLGRPSFAGSAQFRNKLLHVRHSQAGNQVVAGACMVGAVAARHDVTETVRAEQRVEQRVKKRQ
jgi:hypothetical protein